MGALGAAPLGYTVLAGAGPGATAGTVIVRPIGAVLNAASAAAHDRGAIVTAAPTRGATVAGSDRGAG